VIEWVVRRPVAVLMAVLLMSLFGVMSMLTLPIQLTPDIETPTITVTTRWPGAAPTEIEREILVEQEEVLKTLQGLKRMTGEATSNQGTLTLELAVGADLDEALVRVSNRLAEVPRYPENARQPVIATADSAGPPLAVLLLHDPSGADVGHWRTWADDEVVARLKRVPGVADIRYFGGRGTQIEVRFDPTALAGRGVTVEQITRAVQGELVDVSGGDVELGKRSYLVRTEVAPDALADLERVVLRVGSDGVPVRLGDVAEVREGLAEREAYVIGDDHEAMAMLLSREAGFNVLEVTRAVRAEVDRLNETRLAAAGLELRVASDQVGYIEAALWLVEQNIVVGGLLAMLVLVVFLRSVRAASVIAVAIPVCVIGTALGMSLLGRTVNVVSLAGMAFAVGMVVDNAIVVLESIDLWRRKPGVDLRTAAVEGTREVWGALLASTATTAVVFVPIIGWQDEVGELLRDIALAVVLAVSLSLVVSILVIPSFAARLLGGERVSAEADAPGALAARVGRMVGWVTAGAGRAITVVVAAVASTTLVAVTLLQPLEYLPTGNRNLLFGQVIAPPGTSVSEMMEVGRDFQAGMAPHLGVDVDGVPAVYRSFFVARNGFAFIGASTMDDARIGDLVAFYRSKLREIPGSIGVASQAGLFGRNLDGGRTIDVEVSGADLGVLLATSGRLMGALKPLLPTAQIRPIPSLDLGAPELRVVPRREDMARVGLSAASLGAAVDALVDGSIIGAFGPEGEPRLDVVLQPTRSAETPEQLGASPLATPSGAVVTVGSMGRLVETIGPSTIQRIERRRAITLRVSPSDDMALEDAMATIRAEAIDKLRDEGAIPDEVRVDLAGTSSKLELAKTQMGQTLLLALLISYLLLAALFEDLVAPIAILVTVPMAAAGGVLALGAVDAFLAPQPLDMMTALGFVMLLGVVVNNAILVVDAALVFLADGDALAMAVRRAVERRLRPMLMTTLTSLAGLLPLVLMPGSGSELYRGIGAVVLGGLSLATVLTLVVVPAMFTLLWRLRGHR
jgi:HAE1 family hydrophobic/amphiphilic exporter-1